MSSIDKLLVRGIRSFDPFSDVENVIQFYSPLTIIVGHNGAGKTTIIECLKYATCGDLPPNSKGGAFIHDPKLAMEREVKAQIKLKFRNINEKEVVCTRSMQLTQKKATSTFKTLESVLQIVDPVTGQKRSISNRCQELDEEMVVQLGVSKAILENVIFCHQEESNWPLSEPAILKKKFDDIFASTRYTKALDNMKVLRKERTAEIKLDHERLKHLDTDKQRAKKIREKLADVERRIASNAAKVAELDELIAEVTKNIGEILTRREEYVTLQNNIDNLMKNSEYGQSVRDGMASRIKLLTGSDDDLHAMLEGQVEQLSTAKERITAMKAQQRMLTNESKDLRSQYDCLLTEQGQLREAVESQNRRLKLRDELLHEIAQARQIRGFGLDSMTSADVQRFMGRLNDEIASRQRKMDDLKSKGVEAEIELSQRLQAVTTKMSTEKERSRLVRHQLDNARRQIADQTNELSLVRITQAAMDERKRKLRQESEAMVEARQAAAAEDVEPQLRQRKAELRDYEENMASCQREICHLNLQADTRARLALKKSERDRKAETLAVTARDATAEYKKLVQGEPSIEELPDKIGRLLAKKERELKECEARYERVCRDLSRAESQLENARDEIAKKQKLLHEKKTVVQPRCGDDDYSSMLRDAENRLNEAKEECVTAGSLKNAYETFLRNAQRTKKCPLCVRAFTNATELNKFFQKLEGKSNIDIGNLNTILHEAEGNYESLRSVQLTYDEMMRLSEHDIPQAKENLRSVEERRNAIAQESEDVFSALSLVKAERETLGMLKSKAQDMFQVQKLIQQLDAEITNLERDVSRSGSTKTVNELQRAYEDAIAKCKFTQREVERLNQEAAARQTRLLTCEKRVYDAEKEVKDAEFQLRTRVRLEQIIAESRTEAEQLEKTLQEIGDAVSNLQPHANEVQADLHQLQQKNKLAMDEADGEVRRFRASLDRLSASQREIDAFSMEQTEDCLKLSTAKIAKIEEEMAARKTRFDGLAAQISELELQLANSEDVKRNIKQNLEFRKMDRSIACMRTEMEEMRRQAAAYDKRSYDDQYRRLHDRQKSLEEESAGLNGETRQLKVHQQGLVRELDSEYKDVDALRTAQYVKVTTSEMANEDLEKYSKALDNAIMQFHALKMEEINKIIRELWINTYKGNDVDTIEIRSDTESTKGNRSYNYRVVLIKGDSVLDMRGRCSAGQKVLASIIIRLALAESFGLNCGILALDEPTTNLDRENIESLADSLKRIILARRQQKNFQLIIITHDEDFMRLLGKSEFADFYYRVRKDESQHSIIERQPIGR